VFAKDQPVQSAVWPETGTPVLRFNFSKFKQIGSVGSERTYQINTTGHFPLEVGLNDVSGGSMSYELGTSAHATVELRDGSVLNGDLESVSATEVVMRIGGNLQHFSRNLVKRMLLVERDMPGQ
jgi:hypothetical protein